MARKKKAGTDSAHVTRAGLRAVRYPEQPERIGQINPLDGITLGEDALAPLNRVYSDDAHGIWLYQGDCLEVLDAIYAKYGDEGRFDMIFADPPYFLSNGGITCHAGKMVKVDKGEWDRSRGPELNHEFNTEWLRRCQRVLKPNGTIWVTGTHSIEPVLWAAKSEKSRHVFNYKAMSQAARVAARRRCVVSTPAGCSEREPAASTCYRQEDEAESDGAATKWRRRCRLRQTRL